MCMWALQNVVQIILSDSGIFSSSPPRDLLGGLCNFRKTDCWLWKWWSDVLGTLKRWWESILQLERTWFLGCPLGIQCKSLITFEIGPRFVSCYFVSWLFVLMLHCDVEDKVCIFCSCFCCESNENRVGEIVPIFIHSHDETIEFFLSSGCSGLFFWFSTLVEGTPSKGMKFLLTMELPSQNPTFDVNDVLP